MKNIEKSSKLEELFMLQIRAMKLPVPIREYKFHSERDWKCDFSWPDLRVAVEIEGGTWTNGRHVQPIGFQRDCKKYNAAVMDGWKLFRGDTKMVKSGELIDTVSKALKMS